MRHRNRALLRALTVAAVLAASAPAAGAVELPDPFGVIDDLTSTSTTSVPSTSSTTVPTTPAPTTTVPPRSTPTTTIPPASATPAPPAAPTPAQVALPDPTPLPVHLAATGADPTGQLALAEFVAGARAAALAEALESASAANEAYTAAEAAAVDARRDAAAAASLAKSSSADAADARTVLVTAATSTLISSRSVPHPSTQIVVAGGIDSDDLFSHGLRYAIALPAADRAAAASDDAAALQKLSDDAAETAEAAEVKLADAKRRRDRATGRAADAQVAANVSEWEAGTARAAVVAALAANDVAAGARVSVLDIPARTLDAYLLAAARTRLDVPACRMAWWVIAGIGAVETGHGTFSGSYPSADGVVRPAIRGPRLDGGSFARIGDTDGGLLDGDTDFDRAVGPMQFIPSTWKGSARDGDGDGVSDPHNVYDAAYAAAHYLCRGARGAAVDTPDGFAAAAWSYNRSRPYGAKTWQRAVAYSTVAPTVVGGRS